MTFPFYELEFGADGQALSPPQRDQLIAGCRRLGATDLIFLAHGFRCDAADATVLYTALLANLLPNVADLPGRTFAVAGVYWPSQKFRESFGTTESVSASLTGLRDLSPGHTAAFDHAASLLGSAAVSRNAQDQFVASVLSAFDDGRADPTEGLPLLHQCIGSDLLHQLSATPAPSRPTGEGGIDSIPLAHPVLGGIDTFLNFMSWSAMKTLSGNVGENGLAAAVLAVQRELGDIRTALVGHSLGGRLMTACCKALGQQGAPQIDSLSLLEAAFSHFGFSPDAGSGQPGFFRPVIDSRIVRGPVISTFSKQDAVVGTAYAVASRLAHDRLLVIGDSSDPYGGIGHNGAQRTPESTTAALHRAGQPYRLTPGTVTCLDGSVGAGPGSAGLITGHGDVTNPHVAYAIAAAIAGTIGGAA